MVTYHKIRASLKFNSNKSYHLLKPFLAKTFLQLLIISNSLETIKIKVHNCINNKSKDT